MKFIFCTLLILIATFSFGQQLSIKEQKEDLNELKTNLYFVHPALFRFTTQSALDSLFEKIKLQINDSISTYEFSDKITPVFSLIEDAHTWHRSPEIKSSGYIKLTLIVSKVCLYK